jgi:membrane associated rhomboid family serine protease
MNWLDKLERKIGKYSISNLMKYIVFITGFVYILSAFDTSGTFRGRLTLEPDLVAQGQIWRLITYIFIPPSSSPIFILITLYFYYMIGTALEQEWGSFRFNVYYLIGMIGTTIAALLTGYGTSSYLNASLFLAFARLYPEYEILLFFILPVKMKYLGWLNWITIIFTILTGTIPAKAAAVASILNYLIFFGGDIIRRRRNTANVRVNKRRFNEVKPKKVTMHKCTVCGINELEDPKMEFRYCSKCEGLHEYCMEHLYNHEHKTS